MIDRLKTFAVLGALLATAVVAAPAQADVSQATFAYTFSSQSTTLLLNGSTLLSASSRGWYNDVGGTNGMSAGNNYAAGICGSSDECAGDNRDYRDFFRFDLSNFSDDIFSAELRLDQPSPNGYIFAGPSLTYTNYDVIGDFLGGGLAVYDDLGSGVVYASTVITNASEGSFVGINLNGNALSALNSARGGVFSIGGAVGAAPVGGVPEPATWALMITGFGFAGVALRRRRHALA